MNSKNSYIKTLSGYVSNRVQCNKQQLANTTDVINDYLNRIEDYVEAIRTEKGYSVDNVKFILDLASRLGVLVQMKIQFSTEINGYTHIKNELELLKNDTE